MQAKIVAHNICKHCGGLCCKKSGCGLFPEDIGHCVRYSKILKKLSTGKYSLILSFYTDEDNNIFYQLRMRTRNVGRDVIDFFSPTTACVFWKPDRGCSLTDSTRPYEGLHLVPSITYNCKYDFTSEIAFNAWAPVQDEMKKAFRHISENGATVADYLLVQYNQNIKEMRENKTEKNKRYISTVESYLKQEGKL